MQRYVQQALVKVHKVIPHWTGTREYRLYIASRTRYHAPAFETCVPADCDYEGIFKITSQCECEPLSF